MVIKDMSARGFGWLFAAAGILAVLSAGLYLLGRGTSDAPPAGSPAERIAEERRDAQRAAAAAVVQGIVERESPRQAAPVSEDLRQARDERLDAMAAAVQRALEATPPEPSPAAENRGEP